MTALWIIVGIIGGLALAVVAVVLFFVWLSYQEATNGRDWAKAPKAAQRAHRAIRKPAWEREQAERKAG